MNDEQEIHLSQIREEIINRVSEKYRKGAEEHQGDLLSMEPLRLVEEAIDECVDNLVYLLTLRDLLE